MALATTDPKDLKDQSSRKILEAMHRVTGDLLCLCNRLLATMVVLGTAFILLMLVSVNLAQHPEQIFHMQAFTFNYSEFSQVQSKSEQQAETDATPTAKAIKPSDPNWDGTLAGAGVGFTLGRSIPIIGPIVGPIAGAMLGYRLDSRI